MDAGVWKLGYASMHRNVRKPALGGNGLNSPDVEYKLTIKHCVTRNNLIFNGLPSSQHREYEIILKKIFKPTVPSLLHILLRSVLLSFY